jgi:hypothetical protein
METIKFIGVCGIVLMIVKYAQPIQWLKEYYNLHDDAVIKTGLAKQLLQKLLNCALCLGFWVGLAFYFDLYFAVCISFAAEILYRALDKLFFVI